MKWTFIIVGFVLLSGCLNQVKTKTPEELIAKGLTNKINNDYREAKSFFPIEFVKFFPSSIDSNYIDFSYGISPEIGPLHLFLVKSIIGSKNDKINKLITNSITNYNSVDSCLLVTNRFATRERYYNVKLTQKEKKIINLSCYKNKYPIPNFWQYDFSTEKNECKLPDGYILYVLDAKPGKCVADSLLTDGGFMPDNWKHGYSKGISISYNRTEIIYWLIIW